MPLENGTFAVGKTIYPLTASTSNSLLQDADTALYWLLEYFANELNVYAGARWTNETARASVNSMPSIVATKFPENPFPHLQGTGVKFPILAIYRVDGKMRELTITNERIESMFEIAWVLPPLSMSQTEILGPFKNAVMQILSDRSEYGYDPNFLDGYNYGQAAGYDSLQMMDYTYMMIPHTTTNLPMQAVVLKLRVRERNGVAPGAYEAFTGVDTQFDLVPKSDDNPASIKTDFVETNSNHNPTNFPGT